jgi:cobalamin biosynthesis Mg chelatase CobN
LSEQNSLQQKLTKDANPNVESEHSKEVDNEASKNMNTTEKSSEKSGNPAFTANNSPSHQATQAEKEERLKEDVLDEDETPSYAFGLSIVGVIVAILLFIAGFYYGIF